MLIGKEPKKIASRLRKTSLTIIRHAPVIVKLRKLMPDLLQAEKFFLSPPADEFNTCYLKEKENDPL
ncbi:MAG: hypothetical protein ABJC98_23970 [Bacteroidota bacterium]